jgi:purine-nucleoside phosphorylase
MANPYDLAERAGVQLRSQSGVDSYDIVIVLGSGWREGATALGTPTSEISTSSLVGFVAPTVAGHSGQILTLNIDGRNVALVSGRVHLYEGNTASQVCHSVRTLIAAGASKVVLTNACGGIDPAKGPGTVVVIRDHINLTSTSPMEGFAPPEGYGSRFVDLTGLYSARLRAVVLTVIP